MPNKLQPKEQYLSDASRAGRHTDTVMAPDFKLACQTALAQYVIDLDGNNPTTALKLEGAKGVLAVLLELGEKSKPQHSMQLTELQNPDRPPK